MDLGGITAASWVTLGGTSQVLVNRGSTDEGLCLMVRETYSWRLAPSITWVALPTINLVWALSATLTEDAQGWLPMIRRLRYDAAIQCNGPHYLLVPDFSRPAGYFFAGFPGYAAMAVQFGWALLASPLVPALRTGATDARPLLWAPCNVCSDWTLRRYSLGTRIMSPSFVGIM